MDHLAHHDDIELIIASVLALASGPLLYQVAKRLHLQRALHVGLAVVVAGLVLCEILPECVGSVGWLALVAAAAGAAVPFLLEHGHGHQHQHGRTEKHGAGAWVLLLAVGAVLLHGLSDGLALASSHAGVHEHDHGHGMVAALLLHRVPEGAALWWLARRHSRGAALGAVALDAAATMSGLFVGGAAVAALDTSWVALFQAFIGGVLLHVLAHGRPHEHAHAAGRAAPKRDVRGHALAEPTPATHRPATEGKAA